MKRNGLICKKTNMVQNTESVLCPWCGTYYIIRPGTNCSNCGGTLPPPAGPQRDEKPQPAPRFLPKQFKNKILYKTNWLFIIGALFAFANFPFSFRINGFDIFFMAGGVFLCWLGYTRAMKKIDVLQNGEIAEGTIASAHENKNVTVNEKHPFIIEYTYDLNGEKRSGSMNCWDETSLSHYPGEPVWVVYSNKNFEKNSSIWPPIG
jgi:hypothetical protein